VNDFVVNVRQIMEYPLKGEASEADAVLLQTGALGGPYAWTTSFGLVTGALGWPGGQVGVGLPLPGNAVNSGVLANLLLTPAGCNTGFNFYMTAAGPAYLETGSAGRWCFIDTNPGPGHPGATGAVIFEFAPPGVAGSLIPTFNDVFNFDSNGYVIVGDTVVVQRDPVIPLEVATKRYVDGEFDELADRIQNIINNSVWSFNGRRGNVTLFLSDILSAGGAPVVSPQFMGVPTAPTAPPMTATDQIATTAFVREALLEANLIGPPGPAGPQGPQGPAGTGASIGYAPPPNPSLGDLWGDEDWGTLSFWDGTDWVRGPQIKLQDYSNGSGSGELLASATGLDGLSETYASTGLATWYYGNSSPLYDPAARSADGGRGALWWVPAGGLLRLNTGTGTVPDWRTINGVLSSSTVLFTASSFYTPPAGLLFAMVECVGGGGAGGSVAAQGGVYGGGGGGGSGGYTRATLSAAQIGGGQTIIVGSGGNPNGPVSNGGVTSFGALVVANGGIGGSAFDGQTVFGDPGAGAASWTGGDPDVLVLPGNFGHVGIAWGVNTSGLVIAMGGLGGTAMIGGANLSPTILSGGSGPGFDGEPNTGAGGTGAVTNNSLAGIAIPGGFGASGWCLVTEYYR
jgi:hypothetical protein